ncbi:hypothetical protein C8J56DRAFT_919869 [Mycena floridula]|nr:hypothetical protein C8J56DRAFT_919869 [Mycena floridula]
MPPVNAQSLIQLLVAGVAGVASGIYIFAGPLKQQAQKHSGKVYACSLSIFVLMSEMLAAQTSYRRLRKNLALMTSLRH